jgi:Zn-dependent protease/CBS domain-containing protein
MMGRGIRIFRVFGIDIRIDWSWLLIFGLVAWNLSVVFSQTHADWGLPLSVGIALTASVLFFGSVLLHELAHSLVANARGMSVRNITLFLFGGVSNIEREPPSPGTEFLMAVVGPLTSIVLGVVLILIASTAGAMPGAAMADPQQLVARLSPLTTLLAWLGSVNVFVGLFNLIPGFPLDGGRLVRSVLWAATGNLRRATRWASWLGQGLGWLMIGAGIAQVFGLQIPLLGGGTISGLWLAFIGWFLSSAASQSYRQVVVHDILEDVPVGRVMRSSPPSVPSDITISSLVHDHVMQTDDHAFPVVDGEHFVGIVTLDDLRSVSRDAWNATTVGQVMTPRDELVTVTEDADAAEAMTLLQRRDVRQLPVTRNGNLAGLLRRRDIIKWLQLQSDLNVRR